MNVFSNHDRQLWLVLNWMLRYSAKFTDHNGVIFHAWLKRLSEEVGQGQVGTLTQWMSLATLVIHFHKVLEEVPGAKTLFIIYNQTARQDALRQLANKYVTSVVRRLRDEPFEGEDMMTYICPKDNGDFEWPAEHELEFFLKVVVEEAKTIDENDWVTVSFIEEDNTSKLVFDLCNKPGGHNV